MQTASVTIPFSIVIDLSQLEGVIARVLTAFLQATDSQPTHSEPAPVSSLPATATASAPVPAANPVADRPKRVRRTKAEIAAAKEAEKQAAGTGVSAPVASVPAVASAPVAATPAQALPSADDLFGAAPSAPVSVDTGPATEAQIETFKKWVIETFIPHPKGGHGEYTRVHGELGNPNLRAGVTVDTLQRWEVALRKQIA